MTPLYPLRFQPILRRYLWGGRRLGTILGKPIGSGEDYAESWEVVDHGPDQSVVLEGPLAGTTLHELVETHGQDLLGRHYPRTQFPLLFKFLDAQKNLSLQVHPDDQRTALLNPPDLGKTEAWYVMDVEPESKIYAGLEPEMTRAKFAREVTAGKVELCVHHFHPNPGDCVLLPAGVVHAIGEGLLIAEIQQASDTTYRLHDWNRVGPDGKPRTLHVDAALEAIDFDYGPANPQVPQPTAHDHITRLAASEKFVLDRWDLNSPQPTPDDALPYPFRGRWPDDR